MIAASVTPFRVDIDESVIARIRSRVADFEWPYDAEVEPWSLGADQAFMRKLQTYWLHSYDWRKAERTLNTYSQYIAKIDELDIHYIHEKGSGPAAMPLLLVHGWPGSTFEFQDLIPRLAHPERFGLNTDVSFDVIVPSLPGYGFSGKPTRPMGGHRASGYLHKLMTDVLGYKHYFSQGGDWGCLISGWLGFDHPEHCRAIHLNLIGLFPGGEGQGLFGRGVLAPESDDEKRWTAESADALARGGAYIAVQSTRPQSLSYAMSDSPMGVAAWIIERFHEWSDLRFGGLEDVFGLDQLLTNIMIYLVTGSFNTAAWMYQGLGLEGVALPPGKRVEVPVGVSNMPVDFFHNPPRSYIDKGYNIQHWSDLPRGGHFAAMEVPELLAEDIRLFFGKCRESSAPQSLTARD